MIMNPKKLRLDSIFSLKCYSPYCKLSYLYPAEITLKPYFVYLFKTSSKSSGNVFFLQSSASFSGEPFTKENILLSILQIALIL